MSNANKLIDEAVEKYGLDGRAYEFDREVGGVTVWSVEYDGSHPVSMSKLATWLGDTGKPPAAQLRFNF